MPRYLFVLAAFGLVAILLARGDGPRADAQYPPPTSFMRDTYPGQSEPNDGASVLVVEGVGAGICGFSFDLNLIAYITIAAINSGRRVVTEISPQRYETATDEHGICLSTTQDWKNVTLQLITNVVNSAPNYGTYWGGIMLDEENTFWEPSSQGPAAYLNINQGVQQQINLLAPNGITWYYTENFTGPGNWSYADYFNITYYSIPAPQIASDYMVGAANHLTNVDPSTRVLVTWSGLYPNAYNTLFEASSPVNGQPDREWGLNLSNCFGASIGSACYGWNSQDTDGDGWLDGDDNCPAVYNPSQVNTDREIDNGPGLAPPDLTVPNAMSDAEGDACEAIADIDHDGISNGAENPLAPCGAFTGVTTTHANPASGDITSDDDGNGDPALSMGQDAGDDGPSWDTDNDSVPDGAECVLGTNPRDRASKPAPAPLTDTDGDGLKDRWERGWMTAPGLVDTDGDGLGDCVEAADVDGTGVVNSTGDLIAFGDAIFHNTGKTQDFDFDKSGVINSTGDFIAITNIVFNGAPCL